MAEPLRITHAPLNVANDGWSLSRGERALGHDSRLAVIATPSFATAFDVDLRFADSGPLARQLKKIAAARTLIASSDVMHYSFGRSIVDYDRPGFELLDLKWARRKGRIVAMTYHGCDVRILAPGACDWCDRGCDSSAAARRTAIVAAHADLLYVRTPDLLAAVPGARYVPQAVSGLNDMPPRRAAAGPFRIVHAPSDRALKGTPALVAAVDSLRARGRQIELDLVEGVSHSEVLERYAAADLAFDQLNAGWYGVFAVEAMATGTPVICRIGSEALAHSGIDDVPIVSADAATLADAIESLIDDEPRRLELGRRSSEFAKRWHDPVRIAREVTADYERVRTSRPGGGGR